MAKKFAGLFFLLALTIAPLLAALSGGIGAALSGKTPSQALKACFPGADYLRAMRIAISYMGGSKEQNGVFITEEMLMLDVRPEGQDVIESNISSVIELASRFERPSYLMLIPTACAIQQSKVPYNNFTPVYDQRQLIDEVYRSMAGNLTVIDVYPTLFNHQNEYIYYHTDNSPTGLGGYYIYAAAAQKLGQANPRGIEQFDAEHIDHDYYGDLYQMSPYRKVKPDRVSTYIFASWGREYTVTHYDADGGIRRYFTLYPRFKQALGSSKDVILGGVSPMVRIDAENAGQNRSLLIFGDETMQSYLPFLLTHYSHVTFVETAQVTPELLRTVDPEDYSQILFAYSVNHFVGSEQMASMSRFAAPAAVPKER